jgi:hypothetical protein
VDRQIDGDYFYSDQAGGPLKPIRLDSQMFLGGYDDFLEPPPLIQQDSKDDQFPDHLGLQGDLLFYWSMQSPACFDPQSPSLLSLAHYPLRIIAAEWMKYVGIMYRAIKHFEYSIPVPSVRDELDKLNTDMRALQRWRRRCMASEEKVTAVLRMLEAQDPRQTLSVNSASLIGDYEHILATIKKFGRHMESMLPVITSLVQIIDSRRSFDETANVSRLTIMALVFVPLAYVSSLFSMTERLGPGGSLFWVYFVVAIPVTIAVVLVAKPPLNILRFTTRRAQ